MTKLGKEFSVACNGKVLSTYRLPGADLVLFTCSHQTMLSKIKKVLLQNRLWTLHQNNGFSTRITGSPPKYVGVCSSNSLATRWGTRNLIYILSLFFLILLQLIYFYSNNRLSTTWPINLRFFSMRISAIDESAAHWLERRSNLHPVRVPRLLILTEGVAPPGLNTLTNWYNRYKVVWLVVQLTCSITSDRSATPVKASVIAQPEQKPCKRLTIITACHLPELKSSVEHRY